MPIYAYRCAKCGHTQDALQRLSDPPLSVCAACGEPALQKQVTAAGFQLKGSGWYVTDFRGDAKAKPDQKGEKGEPGGEASKAETPAGDTVATGAKADTPAPSLAPAAKADATPPKPA